MKKAGANLHGRAFASARYLRTCTEVWMKSQAPGSKGPNSLREIEPRRPKDYYPYRLTILSALWQDDRLLATLACGVEPLIWSISFQSSMGMWAY